MFNRMMSLLGIRKVITDVQDGSRRKHARHATRHAEVLVGDRAYNLRDWSMGGVFFETTPDARIMNGDQVPTTLKFRFPHETIVVQQQARVVRSRRGGIAVEFPALNEDARRQLQRVLDNMHTQSFLESQIA